VTRCTIPIPSDTTPVALRLFVSRRHGSCYPRSSGETYSLLTLGHYAIWTMRF